MAMSSTASGSCLLAFSRLNPITPLFSSVTKRPPFYPPSENGLLELLRFRGHSCATSGQLLPFQPPRSSGGLGIRVKSADVCGCRKPPRTRRWRSSPPREGGSDVDG